MRTPGFRNRTHAGSILGRLLLRYREMPTALVLGLARGGVIVAAEVGRKLHLPVEVFISRKLNLPEHTDDALGAITETGVLYLDEKRICAEPWVQRELRRYVEVEIARQEKEVTRRMRRYRGNRELPALDRMTVILVDEGTVTGATVFAAIEAVRKLRAERVIVALPVAPQSVVERLRTMADAVFVLRTVPNGMAPGEYYQDFSEVSDEAVVHSLNETSRRSAA